MMRKMSIVALVLLTTMTLFAQQRSSVSNRAGASASATETASASSEVPAFNWDAAPVDIVLQAYGERTGKTILKDPQVPNVTITLKSKQGQKLSNEDYLEAIETILEMNQIHLEPYGESFIRALPRKDVRKEGIPLIMDPQAQLGDSGKVVSMWINFKNIGTDEAQKALEGLKSNSGILLVFERTNSILVTDTEQNINRMLEVAKVIDIATPVTEVVEYIQIKYANATEVKQVIDAIVEESMKEQEKNGNAPQNSSSASSSSRPMPGNRLLGRPGQNNNQPTTPANNESLVMTVSDADRGMIRGKVVTIADERSNKLLLITSASNMKFFKEVIAALDVETTPDVQVKVYRLKYADAEDVSDMINDLIGNSASSKGASKSNTNQNAAKGTSGSVTRNTTQTKQPANQRTGESKAGELNKDNVTVLADKRINGLVVMARTEDIPTIESIIESMDIKLSQVLIETVIIEVGLGDDLKTGVDWVRLGDKQPVTMTKTGEHGLPFYNYYDDKGNVRSFEYNGTDTVKTTDSSGAETIWTKFGDALTEVVDGARSGYWSSSAAGAATQYALGGGGGTAAGKLFDITSGVATNLLNPTGSGINYFVKSDRLNLGAIIQASKSDNRSKYIASPIIMTLDNKEAEIKATEMRYLFKGYQYSGSANYGSAVPDYEQKELGITIKVTPKINPNGTVMLTIEEEYSQEGNPQTIQGTDNAGTTTYFDAATTITRTMSADALLENQQTVIFGGLTQTSKKESETGIPILKDIPLIGKWLFGSVSQTESRSELLVFMTPYVLNDSEAAQAEAIRRKRTISDPTPWDDHGWSLSELADPVSKKEQMRRLQDEWRRQDEERRTRIAIEKAKVERAKKLQSMSKEERELWLNMHKEELEAEQREALEEKMLDEESQEELKKLAEKIRSEKLGVAEKELKSAADETAAQNERGRLEAEKAAQNDEQSQIEAEKNAK